MPRVPQNHDDMSLVDLPIITGPTLEPRLYGPRRYPAVLSQVLAVLPNRKAARERRLTERAPVPVRFVWRD